MLEEKGIVRSKNNEKMFDTIKLDNEKNRSDIS